MSVIIAHDRYGERTEFRTLAEAQRIIRSIGGDFATTTLRESGDGRVIDDRGDIVGYIVMTGHAPKWTVPKEQK